MPTLRMGPKRLYEFLKTKKEGDIVSKDKILKMTEWNPVSFRTYQDKHKIEPFLREVGRDSFKVLVDGSELSKEHMAEVFTQVKPRDLTLRKGDKLEGDNGTYTLTEHLGNGAVGHVWSATDQHRDDVAVKVMQPRPDLVAPSKIANVRERFRREAKNGIQLDHPNVIPYFDIGERKNNPFIVMRIADNSVGSLLKDEETLTLGDSVEVIRACVEGLDYLHKKGCVHRDVKPDNILIDEGVYRLGDLGIVKWSDFSPDFTGSGTLTRQSVQLGSWYYMAPEQLEDPHEATPASDIYALGISWIELLTGKTPPPIQIGAQAFADPCGNKDFNMIIRRMVSFRPEDRPSLAEILRVLDTQ